MELIIEAKIITEDLLDYFCESNAVGIRIRNFIHPHEALEIADKLLNSSSLSNYRKY
ncbi:hypothetical protein [Nodularia sphaerocarpa]|uniref:hypothetical protein n=1 Tax=Nodularia sphaerocarpa TaxID=137816 RepID=UPI001EFA8146|nr:hypothetical protein [Nodularia sphaerocarpa]MDB9372596.1 hypothetical protein [Nodularia sphaerocarpa CS-585]MDB9379623.1 hypothetical protein [Nodularia sphaerocarpa CS-585A2]ULP71101.1 hypothetical protein BDGGKGIB_00724 [Nodularia sphaerocarpa UHCC 0038]